MNKLLLLCIGFMATCSCSHQSNSNWIAVPDDSIPPAINKIPDDTVQLGDKIFFVYFIEKADFDKYPAPQHNFNEADLLANDTIVKRQDDKLIFHLANNKKRILANVIDDEKYIRYTYFANYPTIKRKGFSIAYYEGSGFELINAENGDTLMTWSAPVISPDNKYMLCATMDLVAAFDPNGFQLFSLDHSKIKLVGENNLDDWGPGSVHWINKATLLSEYITIDEEGNTQIRYVKMVMQ